MPLCEPTAAEAAEMLAETEIAGVADVLALRDGHALIKFVRLSKGKPPRSTPHPFGANGHAGFLTAVVSLRREDVDEANHRPGLRIRTHLAPAYDAAHTFRTLAAWNSVAVLGATSGGAGRDGA